MGLLGNGFRHNLTGRISVATTKLDGCNASTIPASLNLTAFRRNMLLGAGIQNTQASVPSGKRHPNVWLMPKEGGSISSYKRTNMRIDASAVAEMGFPRGGSAFISFTGNAAGGLIVGATGTATISINGNAAIVATLNATGTATITIDGSAALGAIASMTGEATITVDGNSRIMGVGTMTGSTIETAELTPAGIATAVWQAIAVENNAAGSMGSKLNTASSGGVDLGAMADAVRTNLQAELLRIVELAQLHGLVIGTDLVVTPTARTAGSVVQTIGTAGDTTTVTRSP